MNIELGKKYVPIDRDTCGNYRNNPNSAYIIFYRSDYVSGRIAYRICDKNGNIIQICYKCLTANNIKPYEEPKAEQEPIQNGHYGNSGTVTIESFITQTTYIDELSSEDCSTGGNGGPWYPSLINQPINFNHKKSMNSIVNKLRELVRKEPEKTFVKAGFKDESGNRTADGTEALLHLLWEDKEEELKALADKLLKEEKTK